MRRFALIAVLALAVAACGDDDSGDTVPTTSGSAEAGFPAGAFAFSASTDLAVGNERLLVAVADTAGARLPSPGVTVELRIWLDGREDEVTTVATRFMWAIEDVSGLYVADVGFTEQGIYAVEVVPEGSSPLESFFVEVKAEPFTIGVGEAAPLTVTPTGAEFPLEEITTDAEPEPSFYALSVHDAVQSGRATVVVFATPKFCQTAICGPTLDTIKEIAPQHPDVNFVHVEVFTNLDDPESLEVVPAVAEWGLPTEPWIFVVGADGLVSARFEGLLSAEELAAALE